MVSSFLHILIVTPVLFIWLRERELPHAQQALRSLRPMHTGSQRQSRTESCVEIV
jgi:hypothetical protein